jgi:hypothetical protein
MPFIGAGYSAGTKNADFTMAAVSRIGEREAIVQTITNYSVQVSPKTEMMLRLETFTGASAKGGPWAAESARAGLKRGSYETGLAINANQAKGSRPSYSAGVYVRKKI